MADLVPIFSPYAKEKFFDIHLPSTILYPLLLESKGSQ
jgi:hypothetical protein